MNGEEGLRFSSQFLAPPPNGFLSLSMIYTVSTNAGTRLAGMTLAGDPSAPIAPEGGASSQTETFTASNAPANFSFGGNVLFSQMNLPHTNGVFQSAQENLIVRTRLDLGATGPFSVGAASFTFMNETFSDCGPP